MFFATLMLSNILAAKETNLFCLVSEIVLVGTARCAVSAAMQGVNCRATMVTCLFRPLLRGRGHRSAMSLPFLSATDIKIASTLAFQPECASLPHEHCQFDSVRATRRHRGAGGFFA